MPADRPGGDSRRMSETVDLRLLSRRELENVVLLLQGYASRLNAAVDEFTKPEWRVRSELERVRAEFGPRVQFARDAAVERPDHAGRGRLGADASGGTSRRQRDPPGPDPRHPRGGGQGGSSRAACRRVDSLCGHSPPCAGASGTMAFPVALGGSPNPVRHSWAKLPRSPGNREGRTGTPNSRNALGAGYARGSQHRAPTK